MFNNSQIVKSIFVSLSKKKNPDSCKIFKYSLDGKRSLLLCLSTCSVNSNTSTIKIATLDFSCQICSYIITSFNKISAFYRCYRLSYDMAKCPGMKGHSAPKMLADGSRKQEQPIWQKQQKISIVNLCAMEMAWILSLTSKHDHLTRSSKPLMRRAHSTLLIKDFYKVWLNWTSRNWRAFLTFD